MIYKTLRIEKDANSGATKGQAVPALLVISVMLL